MEIRSERPSDAEAISRVNDLAFEGPAEGALVRALREEPGFDAELSLVAEDDGEVVGHILFTPLGIEEASGEVRSVRVYGLAPMAVLPDRQRQGIGTELVQAGLEACRLAGVELVIVLGHPGYYPRFGFQRASRFGILPPFPTDDPERLDEAFMALELKTGAADGAQGTVRYPASFDGV